MALTLKEIVDEKPGVFLGKKHVERFGEQTGVLVGYQQTPCFRMTLIEVTDEFNIQGDGVFSGLYILSGTATITTGDVRQAVKKGDQLFIPAHVSSFSIVNDSDQPVKALRLFGPSLID